MNLTLLDQKTQPDHANRKFKLEQDKEGSLFYHRAEISLEEGI
jgi:hypothetical protein